MKQRIHLIVDCELDKKKEQVKSFDNTKDFENRKYGISLREAILQAREKYRHNTSFLILEEYNMQLSI